MRVLHVAVVLGVAVLLGCPRAKPPPSPPAPPPIKVPAGCEADLSGTWAYSDRPDWRYRGTDDGKTLVLSVERASEVERPDGGVTPAQEVAVVLERTPEGFLGAAHATVYTASRPCEVSFPTEVVACTDGGLTLSSAEALLVDETSCAVRADPQAPRKQHQLVPFSADEKAAGVSEADAGS